MNLNKLTIILLTIISLLLSYLQLNKEIKSLEQTEEGLLEAFLSIASFVLIAFLLTVFIFSLVQIVKKRKYVYFFPVGICLATFVTIIVIATKIYMRDSSPVILQAHYDGDINGLTLYLRENKTYKIQDFGFLGGTNHYGEYKIKGDTIILSKKYPLGEDRHIMCNKLVRKKDRILLKPDSTGVYPENEYIQLKIIVEIKK